jgi:hypothetical protein
MVQLRVDFNVPAGDNCLSVDFRFLSEEYPEFVGQEYNDGFIAELDNSDFEATGLGISAPQNFAFDNSGHVISVNTTGFAASEAAGTVYDGATPLLRAMTPITPGSHSVYLSVFDQKDNLYDSAAFIDGLQARSVPPGACVRGASADLTPPDTVIDSGPAGKTTDPTPTFTFHSTEPGSSFECSIDTGTPAFAPCSGPGGTHTPAPLADGSACGPRTPPPTPTPAPPRAPSPSTPACRLPDTAKPSTCTSYPAPSACGFRGRKNSSC